MVSMCILFSCIVFLMVLYHSDAIKCFFTEMEANHGITLVSHLLAYATASKYGLTEPEVLDILALDKEVTMSFIVLCCVCDFVWFVYR